MIGTRRIACALLAVTVASAPTWTSDSPKPVRVKGTRVYLAPPNGFVPAELFPGFQQEASGSSIVVNETPAPFSGISKGMTKDGLASRQMSLISSESVRIAGLQGLLLSVSQESRGTAFRKWIAVFGDEKESVMIVASFPALTNAALGEPLKRAVVSAEWNRDAEPAKFQGLTFRIDESPSLKIARRVTNGLMLTKDGTPGPIPPAEPLLVVASSHSEVAIDDLAEFARRRIMQVTQVKALGNLREAEIKMSGLPGHEIVAAAKDAATGAPMIVYQAIVTKDNVYYLALGLVGAAGADKYVPEFRRVASSLSITR